jgi:hypothetical protein
VYAQELGSAKAQRRSPGQGTVTVQLAQSSTPLSAMPALRQPPASAQQDGLQQAAEAAYWGLQATEGLTGQLVAPAAPTVRGVQLQGQGAGEDTAAHVHAHAHEREWAGAAQRERGAQDLGSVYAVPDSVPRQAQASNVHVDGGHPRQPS